MVRSRSVWFTCITLGVILMLLGSGRAMAMRGAGPALPGPGQAWTWQNPRPQGNGLATVSAVGDYIVTAGGTEAVYQSPDAGSTWNAFDLDTNQTIPSVILDAESGGEHGWLIAESDLGGSFQALCMETNDHGATWSELSQFPPNQPLATLFQLDSTTLFAGGDSGYVGVSDDGGKTWDDISIPMTDDYMAYVSGIAFVDGDRGFAATARILYGTTNGGKDWTVVKEFEIDPNDVFKPRINSVAATLIEGDEQDAICVYLTTGQAGAWQSLDGGVTWEKSKIGDVETTFRVSFLSPSRGIITGSTGKVWTTDDSGASWDAAGLPLEFNVFDAAWKQNGEIVACGAGGLLARSRDGGMTWSRIGSGFPWTLNAVAFKDQDTGWAVGEAGFIAGTENGSSWKALRGARDSRPDLNAVVFPTYARGCAVGFKGTVLTTANAGGKWTTRKSGTKADLYGVAFVGKADGWAVGARRVDADTTRGVIRRTADGGAHWKGQTVPSGISSLSKVRFVDDRTGWAVGTPGIVLRTTNGGSTWTKVSLAPKSNLLDLDFVDRKYGWVCGTIGLGGNIGYHTSDGGLTWTRETIPGDASYGIDFIDRMHGWRVGMLGHVIATSDGGATWAFLPSASPSADLTDVRLWSDGTGFVVGQYGAVLKTTTGGQAVH